MANTNKNRKFYIACTVADGPTPEPQTAVPADLAAWEALDWTQVKKVGNIGESGRKDNIVSYDTLEDTVTDKNKGLTNAGDPMIEVARLVTDNGQKAMRAAGATKLSYAFKIVDDDMPAGGTQPTTYYNFGLVIGPVRPNGRNESFNLEQFTLALTALELVDDAA